MSLDPSLKVKGALTRHRNVLTRAERVEKLKEEEKWQADSSVLGMPKVVHRKSHAGRKVKEEAAEAVAGAPGAAAPAVAGAAPAAAPGAKPAAGAKSAAGAKPAGAPAAKPAKK